MSGRVGDLSPQQADALQKLKLLVADVHKPHYDDYYYLRWLRAREFDVKKAETMMRKNLAFRKKIGADTILTDYKPHELIDKYYPRGYLGPDKNGCPVRFLPFEHLDLKGFVYSVKRSEVLKFLTYLFEHDIQEMEVTSKQTGTVVEKHSYIIDVGGYTIRQASNRDSLNMFNDVLKLYEANYPERMNTTYFINAPRYFNFILNLSKAFLSDTTMKKFRVFGRDFQKTLLNDIDADILPEFLGGTRTDPDGNPMCPSIINFGAVIPPEFYVHKRTPESLEAQEGVVSIKVPRQSFRDVEVFSPEVDCRIDWTVETTAKDIAMGLYFKKEDDESLEEIMEPERVSCHLVPESGTFVCEKRGTYVFRFDNSYSWVSSKKVYYKISVTSHIDHSLDLE